MIKLIYHRYGKIDDIELDTIQEAARTAISFREENIAYPEKIIQDEVIIWENDLNKEDFDYKNWSENGDELLKLAGVSV